VTGLNSGDRRSRGEERSVSEEVSGTEVSTNAGVLNHTGGSCHGGNVSEHAGEIEVAARDGGAAKLVNDSVEDCCMG